MYSYVPYTNVPAPALRSSNSQPAEQAKKGTDHQFALTFVFMINQINYSQS